MAEGLLHYDQVGSFLRPERLITARTEYTNGTISQEELTRVEDEEILKLVARQKELGFSVVSDGEFRRSYWHLDYFWGFEGVEHIHFGEGYKFHDEETRDDSARLNGKIRFSESHPFLGHFKFLKDAAGSDGVARVSIPAPAQMFAELVRGANEDKVNEIYPDRQELIDDLCSAYRDSILAFYDLGCRDLKLDDCTWAMLCDRDFWELMAGAGFELEDIQKLYLELNNKAVRNLPPDLRISTHVCRGNYHSTYATSGGYEPVGKLLFGEENVETYFLEYDDERSGDFEPLRHLKGEKNVVLGLITSKQPELEDKEAIKKRIQEASKYVPLERLALSPQCGFASTEEGNKLSEEDQWKKMKLVKEIADEVWG